MGYNVMSNKKVLIGIIIIVVAIIIVGVIMFIPKGETFKKTVFISTNDRITVINNKMVGSFDDIKVKKQNVKVYYDGKIIDGYVKTEKDNSMDLKNALTVYDEKGNLLDIDKLVFSYTSDLSPNIININFEEIETLRDIMRPLIYSYIDIEIGSAKLDYCTAGAFDLDGDNNPEYIYSVGLSYEGTKYTSAVFMEKDGVSYIINNQKSDFDDPTRLSLLTITDFNNDGLFEFVVGESYDESTPNSYSFYNFDGTKFNSLDIY